MLSFYSEITQMTRSIRICSIVENGFFEFPKVKWLQLTGEVD